MRERQLILHSWFFGVPSEVMRPTALVLNIIRAGDIGVSISDAYLAL